CRICGSLAVRFDRQLPVSDGDAVRYYVCLECGTVQSATGEPLDYTAPRGPWASHPRSLERFLLEVGADVQLPAAVLTLLEAGWSGGRPDRPRLLEVGCGLGVGLHMARLRGWEGRGIEPAHWAGATWRLLGVEAASTYLEDASLGDARFQAVVSIEVLE